MRKKLYMDGTKLNRHLSEVVKWQQGEWFAPLHMEISITNICNQRCTFCYINWLQGKVMMGEEMLMALIADGKKAGIKSALIAGEGEPTLNPAYVPAIEKAGEVGLDIALNTNAVKLNHEDLERILPHLSWLRCSVQASDPALYSKLHGSPEAHFNKAIAHIEAAARVKKDRKLKLAIGIQQVLLDENGQDSVALARLSRDIGVDYYVIKPCHPHQNTAYEKTENLVEKYRSSLEKVEQLSTDDFKAVVRWNFLAESKRKYTKCLGLPFIIQIGADGKVYTCYPMADNPDYLYGELAKESIIDILRSDQYQTTWKKAAEQIEVRECMATCRQHNVNNYLWWLEYEKPDHINFI